MSKKQELDVELSEVVIKSNNKPRRASEDQSNGQIKTVLRHTQSHSSQRRSPSVPTIVEEDQSASGITLSVPNLPRKISTASGITAKSTVRESGRSNKSSRSQASNAGSTNRGFTNSDGDAVSYQSRYSSNQSLSTYKEQYCCSPNCRFTPRERKLCVSVAVLATIIVILVIVVGVLADKNSDNDQQTFRWKF